MKALDGPIIVKASDWNEFLAKQAVEKDFINQRAIKFPTFLIVNAEADIKVVIGRKHTTARTHKHKTLNIICLMFLWLNNKL